MERPTKLKDCPKHRTTLESLKRLERVAKWTDRAFIFLLVAFVASIFGVILFAKAPEKQDPVIETIFPAEDIRCVQQDGKIVFCESYREEWR
jgi:hypothetical protein